MMLSRLVKGLIKRRQPLLRDTVMEALALHRRGEVRTDDLQMMELAVRMQVRWRAREIHPWDRDLPPGRAARKLSQQCLSDTEAALERLFVACPEVDVIEVEVLEPNADGERRVMCGTVRRAEFAQWHPLSTDMRFWLVGLHYRLVDDHLQLLPPERFKNGADGAAVASGFGGNAKNPISQMSRRSATPKAGRATALNSCSHSGP
jgi:hypothetical protein